MDQFEEADRVVRLGDDGASNPPLSVQSVKPNSAMKFVSFIFLFLFSLIY